MQNVCVVMSEGDTCAYAAANRKSMGMTYRSNQSQATVQTRHVLRGRNHRIISRARTLIALSSQVCKVPLWLIKLLSTKYSSYFTISFYEGWPPHPWYTFFRFFRSYAKMCMKNNCICYLFIIKEKTYQWGNPLTASRLIFCWCQKREITLNPPATVQWHRAE